MSEGTQLVVSPNGDLVLLQRTAPLKAGWRLATLEDCAAAEARAATDEEVVESEVASE